MSARACATLALLAALAAALLGQTVAHPRPRIEDRRVPAVATAAAGGWLGLHGVALSWSPSPTPGVVYVVLRATSASGPWTAEGTVPGAYFLDPMPPAGTYWYEVVAKIGSGPESPPAGPVQVTVP